LVGAVFSGLSALSIDGVVAAADVARDRRWIDFTVPAPPGDELEHGWLL